MNNPTAADVNRFALDAALAATATLRRPARIEYKPTQDITAHEVARLLPVLLTMGHVSYPEDVIPDDLKRHFIIEQQGLQR